jgi:Kef-type K+ transport system membrane component KefB
LSSKLAQWVLGVKLTGVSAIVSAFLTGLAISEVTGLF